MKPLRTTGDNQLDAQRDAADDAARERAELDERSVLYAVRAKLAQGLTAEAAAIVAEYRAQRVTA